jgi:hypothetical protein
MDKSRYTFSVHRGNGFLWKFTLNNAIRGQVSIDPDRH